MILRIGSVFLAWLLMVEPLWAALAFVQATPKCTVAGGSGSVSLGTSTVGTNSNVAGHTFSHSTPVAANRYLLVDVAWIATVGEAVTSVVYGGANLTRIGGATVNAFGNDYRVDQWGLIAPATGANNVTVNLSGPVLDLVVVAKPFSGVSQTAPVGTQVIGSGNGTQASLNISSASNEIVSDVVIFTAQELTVGTGQTAQRNSASAVPWFVSGSSTEPGASTITMSWSTNFAAADDFAHAAVAVKPDTGGASTCSFGSLPTGGNAVFIPICGKHTPSGAFQVASVTDNQGNSYSLMASSLTGNVSTGLVRVLLYGNTNIGNPSGTFTITVSPQASSNNFYVFGALEYSDVQDSGALDVTATNGTVSPTDASVGPSAATAQANELVIAATALQADADSNVGLAAPSAGYTQRFVEQDAAALVGCQVADKIVAATGTQSAAWSHDAADTASILATFRQAPTVAGGVSVTLSWREPTLNSDGTPLTDLQRTQGYYKRPSSADWVSCATVSANSPSGGALRQASCNMPIPTGVTETVEFTATATDTNGNQSTYALDPSFPSLDLTGE